jgi:hypothetical protein
MTDTADQERSKLLQLCLAKVPVWHNCEEFDHVPCGACEHSDRVQQMSTQELREYASRKPIQIERFTTEQLRQRFIERFGL